MPGETPLSWGPHVAPARLPGREGASGRVRQVVSDCCPMAYEKRCPAFTNRALSGNKGIVRADRQSEKCGRRLPADKQYFVMLRVPERDHRPGVIPFSLCDDIRERLEQDQEM